MGNTRYLESAFDLLMERSQAHDRVIDGADSTLDAMERVPVTPKNRPTTEIKLNKVRWPVGADEEVVVGH